MPTLVARLNRPVVAILAVGAIAGVLRFTHLGYPEQRVFDEYYYPKSACIFLGYSNERCDINSADERFWREDRNDTGA
ncbi:MAG: phospholipid carrier-dependent glycosyltransferase, partial [Actinomycetota bacterium]